jgi:transaldolase
MKNNKFFKTKIFCDTADIKIIKKFNKNSLVNGFTTNPTLMRFSGAKNYKTYSKKLLKICKKKPISLEVIADKFEEIEKQAYEIKSWGNNVYVKFLLLILKEIFLVKLLKD